VVLFLLIPFFVLAQSGGLIEVKGIETRWEKYSKRNLRGDTPSV